MDDPAGVSFLETVDHLGGWRALAGAVLLVFALYVFLVEFLMPRRRAQMDTKLKAARRAAKPKAT